MGLLSYIRGDDLRGTESRTLTRTNLPAPMLPYSAGAPIEVNEQTALRVADAYACVRVLADSISSLPLKAFRHLPAGRVPAGEESRIVQLLRSPSPGSTGVDLISQVMVHLTVHGDCFVGKFRSEGSIVQLALLDPQRVSVEMRGQRVVYTLRRDGGETEHGPDDILHIKAMSSDGLRGLSPVSQCRLALSLSSRLQESARQYFEHGSRPSGILTAQGASSVDALQSLSTQWSETHGGVENMHRVAVLSGEVSFTPLGFSADDSQFLQQRELSAREVARVFRIPSWAIDAPTGDSLTYANVTEQNRALIAHSLRPWIVRLERAISADADLCPGSTYVEFSLDGLLRADGATRSEVYTRALDPETGWMRRDEVRELEDLPPERNTNV